MNFLEENEKLQQVSVNFFQLFFQLGKGTCFL